MTFSLDTFEHLAATDPAALAHWIASGEMDATVVTFAAECLGRASDAALVLSALRPLLDHERPYVREGAVYGLGCHVDDPDTAATLRERLRVETSPGVRGAIEDMLRLAP